MPAKIHTYLAPLREKFTDNADPEIAFGQRAYMKGKFEFFGLKSGPRRSITRDFFKEYGRPSLDHLEEIVRSAWAQPQREFHYTGMEMFTHSARKMDQTWLPFVESLILTNSWWDTVDHLAVHGMGTILRNHPGAIAASNKGWKESNELWLQRTALIFQLQYKDATDAALLFGNIAHLSTHKDFFIRKAIGWALRQYARTDPNAVKVVLQRVKLSPLSVKEAMKHIE